MRLLGFSCWWLGAWAQVPDYNTDRQIKLFQEWVAKDPSSISNGPWMAGAYIQKDAPGPRISTIFTGRRESWTHSGGEAGPGSVAPAQHIWNDAAPFFQRRRSTRAR